MQSKHSRLNRAVTPELADRCRRVEEVGVRALVATMMPLVGRD